MRDGQVQGALAAWELISSLDSSPGKGQLMEPFELTQVSSAAEDADVLDELQLILEHVQSDSASAATAAELSRILDYIIQAADSASCRGLRIHADSTQTSASAQSALSFLKVCGFEVEEKDSVPSANGRGGIEQEPQRQQIWSLAETASCELELLMHASQLLGSFVLDAVDSQCWTTQVPRSAIVMLKAGPSSPDEQSLEAQAAQLESHFQLDKSSSLMHDAEVLPDASTSSPTWQQCVLAPTTPLQLRDPPAAASPPLRAPAATALHMSQPGLYQIVEAVQEEQNRALVAKLATPRRDFHALCNDLVPGSTGPDASHISFTQLNSLWLQPVGVMGLRAAIAHFLVEQCQLPAAAAARMLDEEAGLAQGMYLWVPPHEPSHPAVQCFLVVWPGDDSFSGSMHRAKPYCSLLRYSVELCTRVVCLFDEPLLSGFQLGREPFGDEDTGIWKGAIEQHTQQDTNVRIADDGFDVDLADAAGCPSSQMSVQANQDSSMCCTMACTRSPPSLVKFNRSGKFSHSELQEFSSTICQQYSVTFKAGLFDPLLQWAKDPHMDSPACLVLLQHTFPHCFEAVTAELESLRQQLAAHQQEQDRCSIQLAAEDEALEADLKAALRRFGDIWFPSLSNDPSHTPCCAEQPHQRPPAALDAAEDVQQELPAQPDEGGATSAADVLPAPAVPSAEPAPECQDAPQQAPARHDPLRASSTSMAAMPGSMDDELTAISQRFDMASLGFVKDSISRRAKKLQYFNAVAHIFSTTYSKSCHSSKDEIADALINGELAASAFIRQHTRRRSEVVVSTVISVATFGNVTDDRPTQQQARTAIKAYMQAEVEAANTSRFLQAACSQASQHALRMTREQLAASRAQRAAMLTTCSAAQSLMADSHAQMNAILSQLAAELRHEGKPNFLLQSCTIAGPDYYRPRQAERRLDLQWMATEEQPGDQHITVMQVLPQSADADDGATPPQCGITAQLMLDISPDEALILAQPISQSREQKVLVVVANQPASTTAVHLLSMHRGGRRLEIATRQAFWQVPVDEAAFDGRTRCLALLCRQNGTLCICTMDACFSQLRIDTQFPLLSWLPNLCSIRLVPTRRELLAISPDRVDIVDLRTKNTAHSPWVHSTQGLQLLPTPEGSMLLVLDRTEAGWTLEALSLDEAADPPLFKVVKKRHLLPRLASLPKDTRFHVGMVGAHCYLLVHQPASREAMGVRLLLSSRATTNVLAGSASDESEGMLADTPAHALLSYFYHIFEKYPARAALGNTLSPTHVHFLLHSGAKKAHSKGLLEYTAQLWEALVDTTKKDFQGVEFTFHAQLGWHLPSGVLEGATPLGAWVAQAITRVPIQLCRVEGGQLQPMSNGQRMAVNPAVDSMDEIASLISFGLYDSVLEATKLPLVVVSSMGAQSTGKSYQLNHLGGTLFGVSGKRCTDGILMTVRSVVWKGKEMIVVFLDCEGMNSWERLEIEDQMLALMSAALSNLTLLKTHFTFDRYVSQMLQRFNLGASKVYRGSLMFALKDTQASAVKEVRREFVQHLERMVQQQDNFLSTMYSGRYSLADFPSHQSRAFYRKLDKVAAELAATEPHFKSGSEFSQVARMLLAKLSNSDWTPLDRDQIRSRVALLQSNLANACHFGNLSGRVAEAEEAGAATNLLSNMDTQLALEFDDTLAFPVYLPSPAAAGSAVQLEPLTPGATAGSAILGIANYEARVQLPDHAMALGSEEPGTGAIANVAGDLAELQRTFSQLLPLPRASQQEFGVWHSAFRAFVKAVVERRGQHVELWLNTNMASFLDDPEALAIQSSSARYLTSIQQHFTLCRTKCESCYLPCVLSQCHDGSHACSTDHRCSKDCDFCLKAVLGSAGIVYACAQEAGHPGGHMCNQTAHTCSKQCQYAPDALNCAKLCRLLPDHQGPCDCKTGNHLCGQPCSLPGCGQRCKEPHGSPHERHWCSQSECPSRCILCGSMCASSSHFHALDPAARHLCSRQHACVHPVTLLPFRCKSLGVCEIRAQPTIETRTFSGQRSNFEYAYKVQQVEVTQICCKPIPPGQLVHDGPHTHTLDPSSFHYCGHPCPTCGYRCTKPYGHKGLHKTQHGNMINANFFSVNGTNINVGERRYVRGETGIAECCDTFCIARGRGHVHVIPCQKDKCSSDLYDQHRHAQAEYTDGTPQGAEMPKDELTHAAYWELMGFEDPTPPEKQREFALCGVQCGSEVHDEDADEGRPVPACALELWHPPQPAGTLPSGQLTGYISAGGHFFTCTHGHDGATGPCHTTFIIDRSGSMGSNDSRPRSPQLVNAPGYSAYHLNNKLGVVYEAILSYTNIRQARSPGDLISFVAFDDRADVVFEQLPVGSEYLGSLLRVHPRGGTLFTQGLFHAFDMLRRHRSTRSSSGAPGHLPVFILLTDSGAHDVQPTLSFLQQHMLAEAGRQDAVKLHALGFGQGVDSNFMSSIASLGGGSFQTIVHSDDIGRLDLLHAFEALAERPDAEAALMTKAP